MRDLLISCTAGYWNRNILIDTNEEEEFDLENELIISYLPNEKKIDGLELKNAKLREEEFKNIERVVLNGCQELFKRLRKVLLDYAHKKMLVF
jgi:ribonuclease PH